jgi:hypothetical protein
MKTTNQRLIAAATLITCLTNLQFAQAQDYLDMPTAQPATQPVAKKAARSANQVEGQTAERQKKIVVVKKSERVTPALYQVPSKGGEVGVEISYQKLNDSIKASRSSSGTAKNGEISTETDMITTKAIYSFSDMFAIGLGAGYIQSKNNSETVNTFFSSTGSTNRQQTNTKGASDPILTGKMTLDTSAITFGLSLDAQLPVGKAESTTTATSETTGNKVIDRSAFNGGGSVEGSLLAYTNNNSSALFGARLSYLNRLERSESRKLKFDITTQNSTVKTTGGSVMDINTFAESVSSDFIRFGGALGYAKQDDTKEESSSNKFTTTTIGAETATLTAYMNLIPSKGLEIVPSISYIELLNKGKVADSIFQNSGTGLSGGNVDSVTRWQAGILGRISF